MASKIYIYKTALDMTRNMVIEDLETYLSSKATLTYSDTAFQLVKPQLEQTIKISLTDEDSASINTASLSQTLGNFVKIVSQANTDSNEVTCYYFIKKAEWVSDRAVKLTLFLDTLNSFWSDIVANITSQTHILRQHKDRFLQTSIRHTETITFTRPNASSTLWSGTSASWTSLTADIVANSADYTLVIFASSGVISLNAPSSAGTLLSQDIDVTFEELSPTTVYRKVDREEEDIVPTLFTKSAEAIEDSNSAITGLKWYLIYDTEYTDGADNTPVTCYCRADSPVSVYLGGGDNSLPFEEFEIGKFYFCYIDYTDTTSSITFTDDGSNTYVATNSGSPNRMVVIYRNETSFYITEWTFTYDANHNLLIVSSFTFRETGYITVSTSSSISFNVMEELQTMGTLSSSSFAGGASIQPYSSTIATIPAISSLDRTDSSLIKIVELPYAPFTTSIYSGTTIRLPTGWVYTSNGLKLITLNQEFQRGVNSISLDDIFTVDISSISETDVHSSTYESKLYHSSFYANKLVYDTNSYLLKPELITPAGSVTESIQFKPANTISSNLAFRIDLSNCEYTAITDFANFIISNRDNEIPLYNSEYLNYIRYGRKYDVATSERQLATSLVSAGVTTAGAIAVATMASNPYTAGIALAVSLAGSIISIASTAKANAQSIAQKEEQLANQTATVRGNNDLNIFKWYSNNSLYHIIYEPSENMKNAIYNMFRLAGYACSEYAIPSLNTRIWYNYIQCEPVFNKTNSTTYQAFVDEIKYRLQLGATVFHNRNNEWDIDQVYENYESWLID